MAKAKKEESFSPGDKVRLMCGKDEYEGILLPRKDGDSGFITLKMPSGYNMGVSRARVDKAELVEKGSATVDSGGSKAPLPLPNGKTVSIIACGGTIASRIDYKTGAVYPATTPEELLSSFPKIDPITVRAKTLFSMLSEDMAPGHWVEIAKAAHAEIKGGAQGVVITHGTDTMTYTSSALSFMLQNLSCPIVLTGSQRSSDRGSSDSAINMQSAVTAAKADLSGVFVCMHEGMSDESCALHFGAKVRKMHTTRRDAFRSINVMPAARIFPSQNKVEKISDHCLSRRPEAKPTLDTKLNTNVALIYSFPGIQPKFIESLSGYDGVVIAGTGLGHIPINRNKDKFSTSILEPVKKLIASGIPVVLTSQCIYGRVDMNVYANGRALREAGVIGHMCDFTPECAYTKLMWALGHEKKQDKIQKLMETNLAGEISERSEIIPY